VETDRFEKNCVGYDSICRYPGGQYESGGDMRMADNKQWLIEAVVLLVSMAWEKYALNE
jgi:hypothetical protein